MPLRRFILLLVCVAFVAAPLHRVSASSATPVVSHSASNTPSNDSQSPPTSQRHSPSVTVSQAVDMRPCCPANHTSQVGNFCPDCMMLGAIGAPRVNRVSSGSTALLGPASGQGFDRAGDTPVPKI